MKKYKKRTCSETEYGDKRTEKGEQAKRAIKMTLASILTNFTVQRLGWIGGGRGLSNSGNNFIGAEQRTFYVSQTDWNTIQPFSQTIYMYIFMNNSMQSSKNERL